MHEVPKHSRCPSCAGNMEFDISAGKLRCMSCNVTFTVPEYEKILREKESHSETALNQFISGASADRDENGQIEKDVTARSYTCTSCGGEMSPGALGATDHCPFCGNAIVFIDKYKDQRMPDFIIPFKKDRNYFYKKFNELMDDRLFLPDKFCEQATFENIKAVYVPFWLFNVKVEGTVQFSVEMQKKLISNRTRIKHTVYNGKSEGAVTLQNVPQDATSEIADDITQALEPYDTREVTDFSFGYLSGLDASIYDLDDQSCFRYVKIRSVDTFEKFIANADKFDYYSISSADVTCTPKYINYALFPIWMTEVNFNGQSYRYAMNGQTGKGIEEFPVSQFKKHSSIWASCFFLSSLYFYIVIGLLNLATGTNKTPIWIYILLSFLTYMIVTRCVIKWTCKSNCSAIIYDAVLIVASFFIMHLDIKTDFLFNFQLENIKYYFNFAAILAFHLLAGFSSNRYVGKQNLKNLIHNEHNADSYRSEKDCWINNIYFEKAFETKNSRYTPLIRNAKTVKPENKTNMNRTILDYYN